MAGLGAGAGAAARMRFDEEVAQKAADRKLQYARLNEESRRAEQARNDKLAQQQWDNTRQERIDALNLEQRNIENSRRDRLDAQNLEQQQRDNARQDRLDAQNLEQQQRDNARQDRLDAQNLEQQNFDNARKTEQDAWNNIFNQQKMEQQDAYMKRQNALDQEIFDRIAADKKAKALRQQGITDATKRIVNFAINTPSEFKDGASQYQYLQAMNAQMAELTGQNPDFSRVAFDPNGGVMMMKLRRDDKGKVVTDQNGSPLEDVAQFIPRHQVDEIANEYGLQYDPYAGAFVQKGSTAYTTPRATARTTSGGTNGNDKSAKTISVYGEISQIADAVRKAQEVGLARDKIESLMKKIEMLIDDANSNSQARESQISEENVAALRNNGWGDKKINAVNAAQHILENPNGYKKEVVANAKRAVSEYNKAVKDLENRPTGNVAGEGAAKNDSGDQITPKQTVKQDAEKASGKQPSKNPAQNQPASPIAPATEAFEIKVPVVAAPPMPRVQPVISVREELNP